MILDKLIEELSKPIKNTEIFYPIIIATFLAVIMSDVKRWIDRHYDDFLYIEKRFDLGLITICIKYVIAFLCSLLIVLVSFGLLITIKEIYYFFFNFNQSR